MNEAPHIDKIIRDYPARIYTVQKLEEAGNMAISLINLRVQSGKDLSGNPFEEYTSKYLAHKIATARYSGRVDLMYTGQMLRDMKVNVYRDIHNSLFTVEVGYIENKSPAESISKARWHNQDGAGKRKVKRTFVGLTGTERDQILRWLS